MLFEKLHILRPKIFLNSPSRFKKISISQCVFQIFFLLFKMCTLFYFNCSGKSLPNDFIYIFQSFFQQLTYLPHMFEKHFGFSQFQILILLFLIDFLDIKVILFEICNFRVEKYFKLKLRQKVLNFQKKLLICSEKLCKSVTYFSINFMFSKVIYKECRIFHTLLLLFFRKTKKSCVSKSLLFTIF